MLLDLLVLGTRRSVSSAILSLGLIAMGTTSPSAGSVPEQEPNDSCNQPQPFGCNQVLAPAFLQPNDQDWYEFSANEGDVIVIETGELQGGDNTNTVLELFADDCATLLAADDNSGNGVYSRIDGFIAPYDGTYEVVVVGASPTDQGPYALVVDCFPQNLGLSRQDALDLVLNQVIPSSPYADSLAAFFFEPDGPDSTLPAGITVADWDSSWAETIPSETYFFWFDDETAYEFIHHTTYVFVDKETGFIQAFEGEGWPIIEGDPITRFLEEKNDSPELVYGNYINEDVSFDFTPQPRNPSSEWALVFVGRNGGINSAGTRGSEGERKARVNDIARIKDILNKAPKGPKLPASNITVVAGNNTLGTTRQAFCDSLDAIDSNCSKLWIFYIGHGAREKGDKAAGFILRGEGKKKDVLTYPDFARKLLVKDLPEYCIVIEDCHSGFSIDDLKGAGINLGEGLKILKGTVITSSDKNRTRRIDCNGAPFIEGIRACWNDCNGDLNGDNKITPIEAIVWAREQSALVKADLPQGFVLDDRRKVVILPPKRYSASKYPKLKDVEINGEEVEYCFETICYKLVDEIGGEPDRLTCRTRVYIKRQSPMLARKTDPIQYICRRAGKPDQIVATKHPNHPRGIKGKLCLLNLPVNCETLVMKNTRTNQTFTFRLLPPPKRGQFAYDRPSAGEESLGSISLIDRTTVYEPGELVFQGHQFVGEVGPSYTALLEDPIPFWELTQDPENFVVSALLDTAIVMVRGAVPDDATQGAEFRSILIQDAAADSSEIFEVRALVRSSLTGDLLDGTELSFEQVDLDGTLFLTNGTATIDNSLVVFQSAGTSSIPAGASLLIDQSSFYAKNGVSYDLTVGGELDWRSSTVHGALNGLTLDGASGTLDGGGVLKSRGDGLTVRGDLAQIELNSFLVDSSAVNGVVFDDAGGVLQTLVIENSGADDVLVTGVSDVELLDSVFEDSKATVAMGAGLTRSWSTWVAAFDENEEVAVGAAVEVRDAFGALIGTSTVDSSGTTEPFGLTQWTDDGATRTFFTPHEITVRFADWDTTFSHVADSTEVVEITFPGDASNAPFPPRTTELSLRIQGPMPLRSAQPFLLELGLPGADRVRIDLLDVQGRRVESLWSGRLPAGRQLLALDVSRVPSGVYFLSLGVGREERHRRIVVLD